MRLDPRIKFVVLGLDGDMRYIDGEILKSKLGIASAADAPPPPPALP